MTAHSLAGLAGLNALYLAAGAAFLWLVRGAADWIDTVRSLGLAYVVGVVVTGSLWTLLLIVGVSFSLGLVIGLPIALAAGFALKVGGTVAAVNVAGALYLYRAQRSGSRITVLR